MSFYRPHDRVPYDDRIINEWTGEITYPERRVKQSFKAECDINNILKQYSVTGQIAHINQKAAQGAYVDLPDPLDFQESIELIRLAESSFSTLPAKVRDRFGNDPAEFLQFMADPDNQDEAIELGLATRRPDSSGDNGGGNPPPPPPPAAPPPPAEPPKS